MGAGRFTAPAIKWSGSKRSQADEIIRHFPRRIRTYYEPFLGGGSVMRTLMQSDVTVDRFVCSDRNSDLIRLWQYIRDCPDDLTDRYAELWRDLVGADDDKARKTAFFNGVRNRFNRDRCPADFLFLLRTCVNGMPRYNNRGEFNTSFHVTRDGIRPERLRQIIREWSAMLSLRDVTFVACSYEDIKAGQGDFLYLDPPYAATRGMYYGSIDYDAFFFWLGCQDCGYALSFNGRCGHRDSTYPLPTHLFDRHIYLRSGNSSFRRVTGHSRDSIVYESLYLN